MSLLLAVSSGSIYLLFVVNYLLYFELITLLFLQTACYRHKAIACNCNINFNINITDSTYN